MANRKRKKETPVGASAYQFAFAVLSSLIERDGQGDDRETIERLVLVELDTIWPQVEDSRTGASCAVIRFG